MPFDPELKRKLKYSRQAGLFSPLFFALFTLSLATDSAFGGIFCKYLCEAGPGL